MYRIVNFGKGIIKGIIKGKQRIIKYICHKNVNIFTFRPQL